MYFSDKELKDIKQKHQQDMADKAKSSAPVKERQVEQFEQELLQTYSLFLDILHEYPNLLRANGKKFRKYEAHWPKGSHHLTSLTKVRLYGIGIPVKKTGYGFAYLYSDQNGSLVCMRTDSTDLLSGTEYSYYLENFGTEDIFGKGYSYDPGYGTIMFSTTQYVNRPVDNLTWYLANWSNEMKLIHQSSDEDHYWSYKTYSVTRRRTKEETIEQIKQYLIAMASR